MLRREPKGYAVVLSDMRMPEMPGSVFLREARRCAPTAVRMLLTGYADSAAAAQAVNDGQIFRFLTKPCEPAELKRARAGALAKHRMETRRARTARADAARRDQGADRGASARQPGRLRPQRALEGPDGLARPRRRAPATLGRSRSPRCWSTSAPSRCPRRPPRSSTPAVALTAEEVGMAARVPQITGRILESIPRLEGRARDHRPAHQALRLGRPPRGRADAADRRRLRPTLENEGAEAFLALETMRGRAGVYDPELLETFARTRRRAARTRSTSPRSGSRGSRPACGWSRTPAPRDGRLLIARGNLVTAELLERLGNFPPGHVNEPLRVVVP